MHPSVLKFVNSTDNSCLQAIATVFAVAVACVGMVTSRKKSKMEEQGKQVHGTPNVWLYIPYTDARNRYWLGNTVWDYKVNEEYGPGRR